MDSNWSTPNQKWLWALHWCKLNDVYREGAEASDESEKVKVAWKWKWMAGAWKWKSLSRVWLLRPHGLCSPWTSPGQNTVVGTFLSPVGLFNPGIEPRSPSLQAGSLLAELSGKPWLLLKQLHYLGKPSWLCMLIVLRFWFLNPEAFQA